jgi:hypothetical protein
MSKTIVTHFAPDVDAISSVWLLKRFLPGWGEAEVVFVPAGNTLNNQPVDSDENILHVDTGMGLLDHHHLDEYTCAAIRTADFIKNQKQKRQKNDFPDHPLVRLLDVVNDIDHFKEAYYPNATADYYDLGLVSVLDGLKLLYPDEPQKLLEFGLIALDGAYKTLQNKVWAENELEANGIEFSSPWGQAIAIETVNDEAIRLAQKKGFVVAVRKDPKKGYVRIKALPDSKADFTNCYTKFKKKDPKATWYLHISKKMLLNGSVKNPESKPTGLTLKEIIKVIEK